MTDSAERQKTLTQLESPARGVPACAGTTADAGTSDGSATTAPQPRRKYSALHALHEAVAVTSVGDRRLVAVRGWHVRRG